MEKISLIKNYIDKGQFESALKLISTTVYSYDVVTQNVKYECLLGCLKWDDLFEFTQKYSKKHAGGAWNFAKALFLRRHIRSCKQFIDESEYKDELISIHLATLLSLGEFTHALDIIDSLDPTSVAFEDFDYEFGLMTGTDFISESINQTGGAWKINVLLKGIETLLRLGKTNEAKLTLEQHRIPDSPIREALDLTIRIHSYDLNALERLHQGIIPDFELIYYALAKQLYNLNDYERALWITNKGLMLFPDSTELSYMLAHCLLANGDYENGVLVWRQYALARPYAIDLNHFPLFTSKSTKEQVLRKEEEFVAFLHRFNQIEVSRYEKF